MMSERDETLVSEVLEFVGHDQRALVADSVYCALFNAAGDLEGNTAESDTQWFARCLWQEVKGSRPGQWEQLPEQERLRWEDEAAAALRVLPQLMGRIARRCRTQAKALRTLIQHENQYRRRRLREWATWAGQEQAEIRAHGAEEQAQDNRDAW